MAARATTGAPGDLAAKRKRNLAQAEARITQGRAYTSRSLATLRRGGVDTAKFLSDAPNRQAPSPSPDPAPASQRVRVRPFHPTPDVVEKTKRLRQRAQKIAQQRARDIVKQPKTIPGTPGHYNSDPSDAYRAPVTGPSPDQGSFKVKPDPAPRRPRRKTTKPRATIPGTPGHYTG